MYFKYFLDSLYVQSIWAETSIFLQSNIVICVYCIVCNVVGSEIWYVRNTKFLFRCLGHRRISTKSF